MLPKARLSRLFWLLVFAVATCPPLGSARAASGEGALLQATEAFRLSARIDTPGTLHLHWNIAPHYSLYRGRIQVRAQAAGVHLGALRMPGGLKEQDPSLGDVETYHNALDASLRYRDAPTTLRVAVTFQGCHEVDPKICYPPTTQIVQLPLSGAGVGAISLPEPQVSPSSGEHLRVHRGPTPIGDQWKH